MRGSSSSPSLTTVVRKMRSSQMTGDDQPRPSIAVFQTTFSVVLQVTGRRGSSPTAGSASAPRNEGQFSEPPAMTGEAASASRKDARMGAASERGRM